MKLEYDAGKLAGLSEQELKALHKELTQLEKDAHKARALAWKELTRRRSARISEQTREKGRQARYRAKVRELGKDLARPNVSPGMRRLIEGQLANLKIIETLRLAKRGRTLEADSELRNVGQADRKSIAT